MRWKTNKLNATFILIVWATGRDGLVIWAETAEKSGAMPHSSCSRARAMRRCRCGRSLPNTGVQAARSLYNHVPDQSRHLFAPTSCGAHGTPAQGLGGGRAAGAFCAR